jgi:putative ABC transport system permease protein
MWEWWLRDLRYAARALWRTPGFGAVLILTLALGIGVNTAIFSVVDAILLRPLPFRDPDRLVRVETVIGGRASRISMVEVEDLKRLEAFEAVTVYLTGGQYNASGGDGPPEELAAVLAPEDFFAVLGVPLAHGRPWPREYDLAENYGVVISHRLWHARFGGDPAIIGTKITLDAAPFYTVFGVAPPGFDFPYRADIYRSIYVNPDIPNYRDRAARRVVAIGRLREGRTIEHARAELTALTARLAREYPRTNADVTFEVEPLRDAFVGNVRPYLVVLFAVVGLVLLIACANAANLMLARAISRTNELSVRTALGSSRKALVRLLLIESLVCATLGGAAGVGLGWAAVRLARALVQSQLPPWVTIAIDARVLAFAIGTTLVTAALASIAPALFASRPDVGRALAGERSQSSSGRGQRLVQQTAIVLQIALALVLVAGASLMVKSFNGLQRVDLGLRSDGLLTFRVALPWFKYETDDGQLRVLAFHNRVLTELAALPGVRSAALNSQLPLAGQPSVWPISVRGQSLVDQRRNPTVNSQVVSQDYFSTMRIPVVAGRQFDNRDTLEVERVAIVSQRLAERLWPGRDPIGRQLKFGDPDARFPWLTVVGVVKDVKETPFGAADAHLYRPLAQSPPENVYYVVRTDVSPETLANAVTQAVWRVDSMQSTFDVTPMDKRIADHIWPQRVSATVFGAFALLALLTAAVGVFGIVSYAVGQRTREFGIRFAIGAQARDVVWSVLAHSVWLTVLGIGVGVAVTVLVAPRASAVLHDVSPFDPLVFAGAIAILAMTSIVAGYLPARRASRVDPVTALRVQ